MKRYGIVIGLIVVVVFTAGIVTLSSVMSMESPVTDKELGAVAENRISGRLALPREYRSAYRASIDLEDFAGFKIVKVCYGYQVDSHNSIPQLYRQNQNTMCSKPRYSSTENPGNEELKKLATQLADEVADQFKPYFPDYTGNTRR